MEFSAGSGNPGTGLCPINDIFAPYLLNVVAGVIELPTAFSVESTRLSLPRQLPDPGEVEAGAGQRIAGLARARIGHEHDVTGIEIRPGVALDGIIDPREGVLHELGVGDIGGAQGRDLLEEPPCIRTGVEGGEVPRQEPLVPA